MVADAQVVRVKRNVNLRPEQSTQEPALRVLTPSEPPLTLLEPFLQDGYYHVKTSAGEEGYVWGRLVTVSSENISTTEIQLSAGIPGSASITGCGDRRWAHVYHPTRLIVRQDCLTVTGTIVDATATQSHHQADGVRHEGDGDTHGWLRVDPAFASLINDGNTSDEGGNLVFEVVCRYPVKQADAQVSCAGFTDHITIPPVGTHVAITGTLVQEKNHQKWNELHPVSRISIQ
jgi:hypothetical protein